MLEAISTRATARDRVATTENAKRLELLSERFEKFTKQMIIARRETVTMLRSSSGSRLSDQSLKAK